MAGGLPRCMKLSEPVRQTRLLAGSPVYEPARLAARESGFAWHLGKFCLSGELVGSGEEFESLLNQVGGTLAGIAGAVEFHGAVAFIVAVFQNAESLRHVHVN
jgi:hypothetical protein